MKITRRLLLTYSVLTALILGSGALISGCLDTSDDPTFANIVEGALQPRAMSVDRDGDGTPDALVRFDYGYNGQLSLQTFTSPAGLITERWHFTYDGSGQLVRQTIDRGADGKLEEIWSFNYDTDGRPLTQQLSGPSITPAVRTFDYDGDHLMASTYDVGQNGADLRTSYSYDAEGRLAREVHFEGDIECRISFRYESGSVIADHDVDADDLVDARYTTYLDDAERPIRETMESPPGTLASDRVWDYDQSGQLTSEGRDYDADGHFDHIVEYSY